VRQLGRKVSQLLVRAGAKLPLNHIAGHQHGLEAAGAASADITGLDAVGRRERPHDRAMFAVAADGDDDG
jgi:hypothetical protein